VAEPHAGSGINLGTPGAPNLLHQGDKLASLGGPGSLPSYGSGWANASNTPWRKYKHYCHEGGISSPLVVHWPAKGAGRGELRTQPAHLIDIMATCIEVAGAKYPAEHAGHTISLLEGTSLVPAFANQPLQRDLLAWDHEGNSAIRVGDWKLVRQGESGPWELYDLSRDRAELHDLAREQPDRVEQLSEQWQRWAHRCHVFPKPGAAGKK
jgi:arylsulfatase A-like enzyme